MQENISMDTNSKNDIELSMEFDNGNKCMEDSNETNCGNEKVKPNHHNQEILDNEISDIEENRVSAFREVLPQVSKPI